MERLPVALFSLTLVLAASLALSCGTSQNKDPLVSITLTPATADAQDFPNGASAVRGDRLLH